MHVSHTHSEQFHRRLRRETRFQAARIALPAIGIAAYYLITSAMPVFEALSPGGQSIEISEAVEDGFTTGVLLTIVAIAVYYLAARALWRLKVAEATHATSHIGA
jgi:hypothetical protein